MNAARRDSSGSIARRQSFGSQFWAMRVIRSDFGIVVVYESEGLAPHAGPRVLVFESPIGKVELTQYPLEWRKLTDADLMLLSYRSSLGR